MACNISFSFFFVCATRRYKGRLVRLHGQVSVVLGVLDSD